MNKPLTLFGAFLLFISAASAQITYPVDVQADRFTFKLGGETVRGKVWPRADGGELVNANTNLVILKESVAPLPTPIDEATEKYSAGAWVDDEQAQTAVFTRTIIPKTQEEQDAYTELQDRAAKRVQLANAIATLRNWSDQAGAVTVTTGNAVNVLQQVVDNLSIFYDRFADLLEVQGIDQ